MSFRTPSPWERKKKKRKKRKTEFEKQVATLDRWFSLYVRFKNADALGRCTCISCGNKHPWKGGDTHAGHFIPRGKTTFRTRWDEVNVQPQCVRCNSYLEGNKFEFGKNLNEIYGGGTTDKLKLKSTEHFNPEYYDMQKHIDHYRTQFNLMIKQAGIKL